MIGVPYEPDFRYYVDYLRRHGDRPLPLLLIGHMFRTSPTKALQAMLSVETKRNYPPKPNDLTTPFAPEHSRLLLADHEINDVLWTWEFKFNVLQERLETAQLRLVQFSEHDQWWVRLYAAEILRQHPGFELRDILERLQSDDHELVRKAAGRKTE